MIVFPKDASERVIGEIRAGGTDVSDRRIRKISAGDLTDLRDVPLDTLTVGLDGLTLGATLRLAAVAESGLVPTLLRKAAGGLATPQIRATATVAGNLLQRNRCWYYRTSAFHCYKQGGTTCPARDGDASRHALFDRGPCISVHPSTLGMALLAYDAWVQIAGGEPLAIADVYGNGADPSRDHQLPEGRLVTGVVVRDVWEGERGGYLRAIARHEAEWPIVEAGVRLQMEGGVIRRARVVVGAVAGVPLRLNAVEARLEGNLATADTLAAAVAVANEGANPVPASAYKLNFLPNVILGALEAALEA